MATNEKPKEAIVYYKGSCACKRITYASSSWPREVTCCHCITCRKLSGAAYQAFVHGDSTAFVFYDNSEALRYEGLPKQDIGGVKYVDLSSFGRRAFCAGCNSPLAMWYAFAPEETAVTLGSVDERSLVIDGVREALKPVQHIFVRDKVWWLDVQRDGIKCLETMSAKFEQKIADWVAKNG